MRRRTLSLAIRFLRADRLFSVTLFALFFIATTGSLLFGELFARRNNRFVETFTERFGMVTIRPPRTDEATAYPHLAHEPGETTGWVDQELSLAVADLASPLAFQVSPRIRGSMAAADGTIVPFVAHYADDWSVASDQTRQDRRTGSVSTPSELGDGELLLAVQRGDQNFRYVVVPPSAILPADRQEVELRLRAEWVASLIADDGTRVATELAVHTYDDPFALALDIRETLARLNLSADVLAWGERLGIEGFVATRAGGAVERALVLITAMIAVAGITAVAVRNRTEPTVLLRTIGVPHEVIRRSYALELFLLGGASTLVCALLLVLFGSIRPIEMDTVSIRRTFFFALFLPPAVGFFAVQRHLRPPLRSVQRDAYR